MSDRTRDFADHPFQVAYAQWLHARAAIADRDVAGAGDEQVSAALEALAAAEWQLIKTPAGRLVDIQQRAQVVQEMFDAAEEVGEPTDNRHRIMLAALISEILRYSEIGTPQ